VIHTLLHCEARKPEMQTASPSREGLAVVLLRGFPVFYSWQYSDYILLSRRSQLKKVTANS
jgi:hypothetical protein